MVGPRGLPNIFYLTVRHIDIASPWEVVAFV